MATPRTEYYNFTQVSNLGDLQPIGYGPFPVDNGSGVTTLKFTGLRLVTARMPQQYVQPDNHLNVCLFDPTDPTKYATYKSNPIATGTAADTSTSTLPYGSVRFTDGDYSLSLDASDWNLYGGLSGLTDGLVLGFYSNDDTSFPTTTDCPNGHVSSVETYPGEGRYNRMWMFECQQYASGVLKYSKDEMVERYANSIDGCKIFADRSTKDANGDQIDTTYLKSADATSVKKTTASLPPVSTRLSELEIFTDGRVRGDSSDMGLLVPYPAQADSGKILQANWSGSPAIGRAMWVEKPAVVDYIAGTGLSSSVDKQTGDVTFTWAYTVGRNLTVNPNGQICTAIPGAMGDASTAIDAIFHPVTNGEFAGAYVLMTRKNADSTYDIGIRYIASGTSSTISFVGTETVIANDGTITVNPAVYMNQKVTYSGNKFGTTTFNPSTHKAIYYSGLAMIGPLSDTKIAIFKDAGDHVKVAFTSMEAKIAW